MRFWTMVFVVASFIFFFIQTVVLAAEPDCPGINSPTHTALKYRLYSAYQVGYGGYEAPCEFKCFGNQNCQNRCQGQKGLEYLTQKMSDLKGEFGSCPSLTLACLEQCQEMGASCASVCSGDQAIAQKSTD
ncbi:MAG: hypothetical protein KDD33_11140 [Bdellovibrionales bacterium]|nr:hypothetical protein [Bdellovibrionales bacterium]